MALSTVGDEPATQIDMWEPETRYNLTITGEVPMLVLVSTSAGLLGDPADAAAQCDQAAWVTNHTDVRETHSLLWTSPKCCEVLDNEVQIFVTAASCKHGGYRQNHFKPESSCTGVCTSGTEPQLMELPEPSTGGDYECPITHTHDGSTHTHSHEADEGDEGDEGEAPADVDEGDEGDEGTHSHAHDADEGDEGDEGEAPADVDEGDEGDEGTHTHVHEADDGDEGDEGEAAGDGDALSFNSDAEEPGAAGLRFSGEGDEGDEGDEGVAATTVPAGSAEASTDADGATAVAEPVAEQEEDSTGGDQKKAARSFGVFVLVAVAAAVAGGIVMVVLRRRRMRQQYQDFGALEMRGYDQWSNQAGL